MKIFRPDQRALLLIPVFLFSILLTQLLEFQRIGSWSLFSSDDIKLGVAFLISALGMYLVVKYTYIIIDGNIITYRLIIFRRKQFLAREIEKIERIDMYRGLPVVGKSAFFTVRKQDGSTFTFRLDENFFGKDRIVLLIKKLLEKNPTIEVDSFYKERG